MSDPKEQQSAVAGPEARSQEGRLQEASLISTIGLVAGVLGLTALLFAAVLYALDPGTYEIGIINAVFSIGAMTFYAVTNRRTLARTLGARSAALGFLEAALLGGALAAAVAVNYFAYGEAKEWDLTSNERFTLEPQSVNVAEGIDHPIRIIGFYGPQEPRRAILQQLFELYRQHTDNLELDFLDPSQTPPATYEKYKMTPKSPKIVLIGKDERQLKIGAANEEALTNALIQLSERPARKVYFLAGHGEPSLEDADAEEAYAQAKQSLVDEGYLVETLNLMSLDNIPKDASAVAIVAPRSELFPNEVSAFEVYMKRGGRVALLMDVGLDPGFEQLLRPYGVNIGDDLVVDPSPESRIEPFGPDAHIIRKFEEHPITRPLAGSVAFLYWTRSVTPRIGLANILVTTLMQTGDTSWGETQWRDGGDLNQDEQDLAGPVPVGVAVTKSTAAVPQKVTDELRLVVFGDASFASNRFLSTAANEDLFVNTLNWLVGDDQRITIRPKQGRPDALPFTERQQAFVTFLSVNLLPLLIVGLGFSVWALRRRK